MAKQKRIVARYRDGGIDDDIKDELERLSKVFDESSIIRAALRLFLFGNDESGLQNLLMNMKGLPIQKEKLRFNTIELEEEDEFHFELIKNEKDDDEILMGLEKTIGSFG